MLKESLAGSLGRRIYFNMRRYAKIGVGLILVTVLTADLFAYLYRNKPDFRNSWFIYETKYSASYIDGRFFSYINLAPAGYGYFFGDQTAYWEGIFNPVDPYIKQNPVAVLELPDSLIAMPPLLPLTVPEIEPIDLSALQNKTALAVLINKSEKKKIKPVPNHNNTIEKKIKAIEKPDKTKDKLKMSIDSVNNLFVKITDVPIGFNQINKRLRSYEKINSNNNVLVNSIEQLIVNNTHTPTGEKLFNTFNDIWKPPSKNASYVITISEKPLPSMNTLIVFRVNNMITFQTQINPNSKFINEICSVAAHYIKQKLNSQILINY